MLAIVQGNENKSLPLQKVFIQNDTMKTINLCSENSVVQKIMSELRDVNIQKDSHRFRWNMQRLGWIMAYEVSKTLAYQETDIQTPLGIAKHNLVSDKVVLATIFRAGLPYHQGFLDMFDSAENAFVSAYRYYKDKECLEVGIKVEYIAAPDLNGKVVIIADPMLATGGSFELAIEALSSRGVPKHTHICAVVASQQGIDYLENLYKDKDVTVWTVVIDPELNEKKYIVPGLGDAGDLCYGTKI